ncbi:MAG: hypothetical protein IPL50_01400 [Chitinophagaceae bacterium]|nr:hypothetical protein [Chitinophagaceae bacterium]
MNFENAVVMPAAVYKSLSGVIGNCLILLPVALYTALAIAGATPTRAISPMPLLSISLFAED